MEAKIMRRIAYSVILLTGMLCSACVPGARPAVQATAAVPMVSPTPPDWFSIQLTDVVTGKTFTMKDFAGKVVLIETMAEWCPNCQVEEEEVKKLHGLLGSSADLISVSLDTDLHEDAASLKAYAKERGYTWYFAIAPLELDRALGNLYSAEYMNPPLAPMLFIDRQGIVYGLPFGAKSAESLRDALAPYLKP
jgi:thiol-disulfide isomerase/thioredoxin